MIVGWFICNAMIVLRPVRVRPMSRVPAAVRTKMAQPLLSTGIEKRRGLLADRVLSTHTLPFMQIAARTCIGQIVCRSGAAENLWA